MSDNELSEEEKKELLNGFTPTGVPMSTEEYKSIWIKHFMGEGKPYEKAKKMVDDMCKKYGIT